MNKIDCDIIQDLLPLHIDKVCSEASSQAVEEHLTSCTSCKNHMEKMQDELPLPRAAVEINRIEGDGIKAVSAFWKRTKSKAFLKGALVAALSLGVITGGYAGLFHWNITKVPKDVVKITDVSQLADGRIAYHLQLTDGYDLNEARYDMDEYGSFYVTPYRPVVKSKPITRFGLFNTYYLLGKIEISAYQAKFGNNSEIKALYLGTRDGNLLIWKKGMELPAASAEVEAMFGENE